MNNFGIEIYNLDMSLPVHYIRKQNPQITPTKVEKHPVLHMEYNVRTNPTKNLTPVHAKPKTVAHKKADKSTTFDNEPIPSRWEVICERMAVKHAGKIHDLCVAYERNKKGLLQGMTVVSGVDNAQSDQERIKKHRKEQNLYRLVKNLHKYEAGQKKDDNEYLEMLSVVANEPERIMRERFKWLREKSLTMWQEFAERNRN